jgi:hypothetical protein
MKILKIVIIALVTVFTFSAAEAQVRVRATIGARPQHRTVVVHRAYHHRVIVRHPSRWHHRPYYRHHR